MATPASVTGSGRAPPPNGTELHALTMREAMNQADVTDVATFLRTHRG